MLSSWQSVTGVIIMSGEEITREEVTVFLAVEQMHGMMNINHCTDQLLSCVTMSLSNRHSAPVLCTKH